MIGGAKVSMLRGKSVGHKYPQMAILKRDGTFVCVANIVHKEWVITPASCITSKRAADYQIIAGLSDLKKYEESEQTVTAKEIIIHDGFKYVTNITEKLHDLPADLSLFSYDFRPETHENDLALINVAPPFKINDRVLVAKLPHNLYKIRNREFDNALC